MISEKNRFYFCFFSCALVYAFVGAKVLCCCSPCYYSLNGHWPCGERVKVRKWASERLKRRKRVSRMRNEWNVIKKITALLCVCVYLCTSAMRCVNCSSNKVPSLETEVTERSFVIAMHSLPFDLIRFGGGGCAYAAIASYIRHSRSHRVNDMMISYSSFFWVYMVVHWGETNHPLTPYARTHPATLHYYVRQNKCPIKRRNKKLCNKYLFLFHFILFPASCSSSSFSASILCLCYFYLDVSHFCEMEHKESALLKNIQLYCVCEWANAC